MFRFLCFTVLAVVLIRQNYGESTDDDEIAKVHQAFYSGDDLKLTDKQKAGLRNRVAIQSLANRWPNGTIPYDLDRSLSSNAIAMIRQAAEHIRSKTNNCIKFVPRRGGEKNYVRMFRGNGCYSSLGKTGWPVQDLSIGDRCDNLGIAIHEMLHAVGFDHEQNRPDRDNYLNIYTQNVIQGQTHNFQKTPGGRTYNAFDFDSIMLYGEYAFSRSPNQLPTMRDKTGKRKLTEPYTKSSMSSLDVYQVKRFYECK